jgi:hypothetical protein
MERADELSLGDNARERLQALLAAVRNADQHYELMLYIERFFAIQVEVRQYFSLIEREIIDKLRESARSRRSKCPRRERRSLRTCSSRATKAKVGGERAIRLLRLRSRVNRATTTRSPRLSVCASMRLGGFEPPTVGLEVRCSSAELQARREKPSPSHRRLPASRDAQLATDAEVGGHDRHGSPAERARSRRDVDSRDADLAPPRREQILAMRRAVFPHVQRPARVDVRRRPQQVLAHRPVATLTHRVVPSDPAVERRAVCGRMGEVSAQRHLRRVLPRSR